MPSDLTLPGDIELRVRRCSPVICLKPEGDEPVGCRGTVQDVKDCDGIIVIVVCWREPGDINNIEEWKYETTADRVALDLTDATGRAHAAWWLAALPWEQNGRPVEGQPEHRACRAMWTRDRTGGLMDRTSWQLYHPAPSMDAPGCELNWSARFVADAAGDFFYRREVPSLAHLDPDDPRLLEDGSRWVDAEALRLVCLHVAGRSS